MELNDSNRSGGSAEEPVFAKAPAPEHASGFWSSLEAEMHADVVAANTIVPGVDVAPAPTELISVVPSAASAAPAPARRWQVLAAAAAVLFVGLLGFGVLRGGDGPDELVSAGDQAPAAAEVESAEGVSAETATPTPVQAAAVAPASQPDDDGDPETDAEQSGDSAADGNTDEAANERFLVQNDQQLLFFADTVPTGTTNCAYADQNVLVVRAPDGSAKTLAGRVYPHINEMVVNGKYFALVTSDCDGAQLLEFGRIEADGQLISSQTVRGRVSDGSPAIFRGINLDASTGAVSFEDAPVGTTEFSPQLVEIDPPTQPTPTPEPTATPQPLPTVAPDTGFADRARLIGSTADGDINWFAVTDPSATCADDDYSQIMVIAADGPANVVHDPPFTYSGDIAFFSVDESGNRAAFVTACGSQLELHVASLGSTGTFWGSKLAWVGVGSPDNALVAWDGAENVALNGLQLDGTPFFVQYAPLEERIVDSNIPVLSVGEGGSPLGLEPSTEGATADGRLAYYTANDPDGGTSCEGAPATTLWVQGPSGDWAKAIPGESVGNVNTFVIDDSSGQVAFSTACEGTAGVLRVGLIQADGTIAMQRTIAMEPYVPGFISNLFWVESSVVRIETDNSFFNVEPKRFEYDLRGDVMLQLDR